MNDANRNADHRAASSPTQSEACGTLSEDLVKARQAAKEALDRAKKAEAEVHSILRAELDMAHKEIVETRQTIGNVLGNDYLCASTGVRLMAAQIAQLRWELDQERGQHEITKDKVKEFERYADNAQAKCDAALAALNELQGDSMGNRAVLDKMRADRDAAVARAEKAEQIAANAQPRIDSLKESLTAAAKKITACAKERDEAVARAEKAERELEVFPDDLVPILGFNPGEGIDDAARRVVRERDAALARAERAERILQDRSGSAVELAADKVAVEEIVSKGYVPGDDKGGQYIYYALSTLLKYDHAKADLVTDFVLGLIRDGKVPNIYHGSQVEQLQSELTSVLAELKAVRRGSAIAKQHCLTIAEKLKQTRADRDAALARAERAEHNESSLRSAIQAAFRKHGLAAGPEAVDSLVRRLNEARQEHEAVITSVEQAYRAIDAPDNPAARDPRYIGNAVEAVMRVLRGTQGMLNKTKADCDAAVTRAQVAERELEDARAKVSNHAAETEHVRQVLREANASEAAVRAIAERLAVALRRVCYECDTSPNGCPSAGCMNDIAAVLAEWPETSS